MSAGNRAPLLDRKAQSVNSRQAPLSMVEFFPNNTATLVHLFAA
jgi:hypothetical protein